MSEMDLNILQKQKDPMQRAVYHESTDYVESEEWHDVTKEKTVHNYLHSLWEVWYEVSLIDGKKKITLFANHKGPIFSRKYKVALSILKDGDDIGYKKIEVDDLDKTQVIEIELEKENIAYEVVSCDVEVHPMQFISPVYNLGNRFDISSRPHDIVLKLNGYDLYSNKVVLALWSNFFDELFFLNPEGEEITEYENKELSSYRVDKLLDMCIMRSSEFHRLNPFFDVESVEAAYTLQLTVPWNLIKQHTDFRLYRYSGDLMKGLELADKSFFDVESVEAAYTLQLTVPWNLIKQHTDFRLYRYSGDLMKGLELADKCNLTELRKACGKVFREYDQGQKKEFFLKNEENMKKLSLNTIHHFLTEGQRFERDMFSDDVILPEPREPEPDWEIFEKGVNSRQDVCLLVGEERFVVHKEYLAFWSPYFDRLFFGEFIEKEMIEVEIKEVEPQEFGTLLRLIYPPGDVKIDG